MSLEAALIAFHMVCDIVKYQIEEVPCPPCALMDYCQHQSEDLVEHLFSRELQPTLLTTLFNVSSSYNKI